MFFVIGILRIQPVIFSRKNHIGRNDPTVIFVIMVFCNHFRQIVDFLFLPDDGIEFVIGSKKGFAIGFICIPAGLL